MIIDYKYKRANRYIEALFFILSISNAMILCYISSLNLNSTQNININIKCCNTINISIHQHT